MEFKFARPDLEALYFEEKGANRYPNKVVDAFFSLMAVIRSAGDERDLRALTHLHYEKVVTKPGYYTLRLKDGWRLEFTYEPPQGSQKVIVIREMNNHKYRRKR
jgi:plasmid maintenance system killer protein